MKLITKELIRKFPKLYETENKKPEETKVIAKFFTLGKPWKNKRVIKKSGVNDTESV